VNFVALPRSTLLSGNASGWKNSLGCLGLQPLQSGDGLFLKVAGVKVLANSICGQAG
jgi:hypothetical protein